MDKEKIEELKAKRLKLQKEVRLKNLRKRVASQISHLNKLDESYFLYYEFENLNWIDLNIRVRNRDGYTGIHGDFQIDVDDSNAVNLFNISEVEINSKKFKELFSSIISTESTLIVCYQGGDPELEFSANAFLNNPTQFFSKPETWILTTDKKWIIEYIWDQRVIRFIQIKASTPTLVQKIIIE
jgi:hypothetical protein